MPKYLNNDPTQGQILMEWDNGACPLHNYFIKVTAYISPAGRYSIITETKRIGVFSKEEVERVIEMYVEQGGIKY